ncbi:MAG: hypothetical protein ACTSRM_01780 [Alphaproteobacteria bacterium]
MYRTTILALLALGLGAFSASPAAAEPEAPAEAEAGTEAEEGPTDEDFAKSLIGKDYEGSLEIEGWLDFGGGLVAPPIYVHHYQREDGKSLVLTSKETGGARFQVIDTRIIPKPWKGYVVSIACMKGDDFTLRFIGDARGPDSNEWWSEVRRAWEVAVPKPEPEEDAEAEAKSKAEGEAKAKAEAKSEPEIDPGKITKANTRGIKCANPNW